MSAPLRVVHLYKGYPPVHGGIEGHIAVLARFLARRGVRSEVLCASVAGAPRREERDGVRVHRCAAPLTLASTPLPPSLPWRLRRSPADLVHLHYPWPPNEVAWRLGGRGRPLVVTVHCEVVRHPGLARLLAPLTHTVFRAARRILVASAFLRDSPLLAAHRGRVEIVPYGIDLDRFHPNPDVDDPFPQIARPRVLFVGRLRHYKGLPVLAAAIARLPSVRLVVAGDGPERRSFEAALSAAGCRDRAHLLGEVDEEVLVRLFQTADAAALPSTSRAEAFGLAIAEAQGCGVPAVVTDVGTGTTQTVANEVSGRVVPPNDPVALVEALAWCVDPLHAPARRGAARAHAEAELSAQVMADRVQQVYQRCFSWRK